MVELTYEAEQEHLQWHKRNNIPPTKVNSDYAVGGKYLVWSEASQSVVRTQAGIDRYREVHGNK